MPGPPVGRWPGPRRISNGVRGPIEWASEGHISVALFGDRGNRTTGIEVRGPVTPSRPGERSAATAGTSGKGRPTEARPEVAPRPESNPDFLRLRELLERGEYAQAVRLGYRTVFDGTVRAYGLAVPPSCSDRQFLKEFLRPDMGRISELLPEFHRRYEPVKFGKLAEGDRDSLRTLLERIYSETAVGRMHDPLYQPSGPGTVTRKTTETAGPLHPVREGEKAG